MKKTSTNQEIILVPKSRFFKKDLCEKDAKPNQKKLSGKEQLINLCWNGMLPELLPEISETTPQEKPLTVWEINETGQLLDLRLGEFDESMNDEWSINPYVYLTLKEYN